MMKDIEKDVLTAKRKDDARIKKEILKEIEKYNQSSPLDDLHEFGRGYRAGLDRVKRLIESRLK